MLPNCRITCSNARTFVRIAREEQVATLRCAHFCQNRARRTNCQVMQDSPASGSRQFCHRSAGSGQRPGARRAFNRAPRSARAVAAGSRILRRRCHATSLPCCSVALLPLPSPSALRASKHAILGSRPWKYTLPYPKTCHFGHPTSGIQRYRWVEHALFAHPRQGPTPGVSAHSRNGDDHAIYCVVFSIFVSA